jgi:hypothetical protein
MNTIEHFYYGQLVHNGTPTGNERVLARSKGVSDEQVQLALQTSLLTPLENAPRTAWGMIRGNKDVPYWLVHAQKGAQGQITRHYFVLTGDIPRGLQGNLKAYLALIDPEMPTFATLGEPLPPVSIPNFAPATPGEQVDTLLDLMGYTRNNTKHIEPLLSAVINGQPLVIQNAPDDVESRVGLVQGILGLLPASTRFSVTFILHTNDPEANAQILFSNFPIPEKSTGYDWQSGKIQNEVSNDYSRFILSQLRLDTELAIQKADSLTQAAGWRFKNGEKLSEALAYASHRASIDQAVENNLPVSTEDVSKILNEDPTLDDAQQIAYGKHLVNFALALNDMAHTEPIAVVSAKHPELASYTLRQFTDAMMNGKASTIFSTLATWMQLPNAPQTPEWVDLLNKSGALTIRDIINERNIPALKSYLAHLQKLALTGFVNRIMPKVLEVSVPLTGEDSALSSQVLLLGMTALDATAFQKMLTTPSFAKVLPKEIRRFLQVVNVPDAPVAPNLLADATKAMPLDHQDDALIRFAEMATATKRVELIDLDTLKAMKRIALASNGGKYFDKISQIARHLNDNHLTIIGEESARLLLQLFLAVQRYDYVNKSMNEQSRLIYGGDRQEDFVKMVQEVVADTPVPTIEMIAAIRAIQSYGMSHAPMMCFVCGALDATQYSPDLAEFIPLAEDELFSNARYMEVIHVEAPLALLQYYLKNRNMAGIQTMAQYLAEACAKKEDKDSLRAIREVYRALNQFERLRPLAFEVLRQYVRLAPPKYAQRVIDYFGKELGKDSNDKLLRANQFSIFINRTSLVEYATAVRNTAELLESGYTAYLKDIPTSQQIQQLYESIRVKIDAPTRERMGEELLELCKNIAILGKAVESRHLTNEAIANIAKGQENPRTIVEIYRAGGGKLQRSKVYQIKLKPNTNLLGAVQPPQLLSHLKMANAVLGLPLLVHPDSKKVGWNYAAISDELDSALKMIPQEEAQSVQVQLGIEWQRLAELIPLLIKDVELNTIMPDNRAGKKLDGRTQLPKNALEFYRYLASYMKA